ncbi:MAG: hypothetical protein SGILL_007499 [Bacillariaceae sp.]
MTAGQILKATESDPAALGLLLPATKNGELALDPSDRKFLFSRPNLARQFFAHYLALLCRSPDHEGTFVPCVLDAKRVALQVVRENEKSTKPQISLTKDQMTKAAEDSEEALRLFHAALKNGEIQIEASDMCRLLYREKDISTFFAYYLAFEGKSGKSLEGTAKASNQWDEEDESFSGTEDEKPEVVLTSQRLVVAMKDEAAAFDLLRQACNNGEIKVRKDKFHQLLQNPDQIAPYLAKYVANAPTREYNRNYKAAQREDPEFRKEATAGRKQREHIQVEKERFSLSPGTPTPAINNIMEAMERQQDKKLAAAKHTKDCSDEAFAKNQNRSDEAFAKNRNQSSNEVNKAFEEYDGFLGDMVKRISKAHGSDSLIPPSTQQLSTQSTAPKNHVSKTKQPPPSSSRNSATSKKSRVSKTKPPPPPYEKKSAPHVAVASQQHAGKKRGPSEMETPQPSIKKRKGNTLPKLPNGGGFVDRTTILYYTPDGKPYTYRLLEAMEKDLADAKSKAESDQARITFDAKEEKKELAHQHTIAINKVQTDCDEWERLYGKMKNAATKSQLENKNLNNELEQKNQEIAALWERLEQYEAVEQESTEEAPLEDEDNEDHEDPDSEDSFDAGF